MVMPQVLREDGGFDYKKAIVESILILIREIPDAKESGLAHLCEFIEVRCWRSKHSVQSQSIHLYTRACKRQRYHGMLRAVPWPRDAETSSHRRQVSHGASRASVSPTQAASGCGIWHQGQV